MSICSFWFLGDLKPNSKQCYLSWLSLCSAYASGAIALWKQRRRQPYVGLHLE